MARGSKKFAGCLWGQKVTSEGVADGPIFRMGNAYPLSIQQTVASFDQVSAMCDTAGQILESRNELESVSGELTLYQYGATEIGWALGANPVAATGTGATVSPAAVECPAVGEWVEVGHKNLTALTITNTGATVTYVLGTDYLVNMSLGVWTPISGGGIAADAEVQVGYTYAAPAGYVLSVGTVLNHYVRLFGVLKDLKSGGLVNFNLKCVNVTTESGVTLISEPSTEYESMSFNLKLLTPPGQTTPSTFENVTLD